MGSKRQVLLASIVVVVAFVWHRHTQRKKKVIRIGSRQSKLAMWQAQHVKALLEALDPSVIVPIAGVSTLGDRVLGVPLSGFTDKGVFTKELDVALLNSEIDLAVHCVKDLPTQLPPGIESFAVLERGEIEDAVVYHQKHKVHRLDALPARAVIGTSALRRRATLHRLHPHLVCKDVRGNVQTRLAKLDAGEYDAILLARTGLTRMGLQGRIHQVLDAKTYGHAVGQGALSCCIREKGGGNELVRSLLARLNHGATMLITCIERGMLNAVEGGCKVPIAVHSSIEDQADGSKFTVRCRVLSVDGQDQVEGQISMTVSSAALASPTAVREEAGRAWSVGQQLGKQLKEAGAIRILQPIRDAAPYAPAHVAPNKQARHT